MPPPIGSAGCTAPAGEPCRGKIGRTVRDSVPDFPKAVTAPKGAPNILIIMTDDVGFGATSTYGGPVSTPTFDRLADRGLRYTQFHTTALSSPTRAALLTGRNHHTAATGVIMEMGTGYPGYNTMMPRSVGSFAEVLRQNGYGTSWYGKNHNVPDWQSSQAGPFDLWPTGLGFEYFYGFVGWCLEVAYNVLETGTWANRGFLNGPICPIYGVGTVCVLLVLSPVAGSVFLLFAGAVGLCSVLELLTGFALDKIFHQRWWDYTNEILNLKGYISLKYSLYWGLGCVFIVRLVHPGVAKALAYIPEGLGIGLLAGFSAVMLVDAVDTFRTVVGINRELRAVHEAAQAIRTVSDGLSGRIFEGTLRALNEREELEVQLALGKAELLEKTEELRIRADELRARAEETARRFRRGQRRLLAAFPTMQSTRYAEDLPALKELIEKYRKS